MRKARSSAFWICAIVAALSAVVSASFSVAALIGVDRQDPYALYAASRSIALLLAILFFGAGFAQAINAVMRTQSGHFIDIVYLMATVWTSLFRMDAERSMSYAEAWIALLTYCGICLALLVRKVRAFEVIK